MDRGMENKEGEIGWIWYIIAFLLGWELGD